ncbi:MAG: purine-nucleoside phosphorylase, partial [Edwardsiella piscicida]
NMAEGLGDVELSHEQTLKCAAMVTDDFIRLISQFVKNSR